jgi:hypothetical protein
MLMGKRKRDRQPAMWVTSTHVPTAASHPFYRRLNQLLREHGFDDFGRSARTHVAHKAEHAVDLETGAIVGVSVHRGIPVVHIAAREMLFTTGC